MKMLTIAKIVNWVALTILAVALGGYYRFNPNNDFIGAFLCLSPYALALIAYREGTRNTAKLIAISLNVLALLFYLIVMFVLFRSREYSVFAGLFTALMFVLPSVFNIYLFFVQLRPKKV